MKMKSFKRVLALALATAMALTACGKEPVSTSESQPANESSEVVESDASEETEVVIDKDSLPVLTFYPRSGDTFSGLVTGHRSDYFAQAGFQLEIWSYSEDKTNAILTSGDLPDIFYCPDVTTLETLIETDKIVCLDDYLDKLPSVTAKEGSDIALQNVRDHFSAETGKLYAIPSGWGPGPNKFAYTDSVDRNTPKLLWHVYEEIGTPEINDMWDLLDVAEEMLAAHPEYEDGTKCYGMFLDNGSEGRDWGCAELYLKWFGFTTFNLQYMLESSLATEESYSILTKDSTYYEALKWYNEAYRRGLMDPDSISTSRSDQAPKVDNGLAMLPAGTLPGWATRYFEVAVPGTTILVSDWSDYGTTSSMMVINKETEHLDECLKLFDMMANPMDSLNMQYGPEGDIWEINDGVISITDEFAAWMKENKSINFFPMSDGTEWATWHAGGFLSNGDTIPGLVDVNGNAPCWQPTNLPDCQAIKADSETFHQWQETMGAENFYDYCEKNGVELTTQSQFFSWVGNCTPADEDQLLIIGAMKDTIVNGSWKCVYAETAEEFEQIWDAMVADLIELGAEDIQAWRLAELEKAKADYYANK